MRVCLTGKIPTPMAHSIEGTISVGTGTITNVYVNGVLVREEITWMNHCILDPMYGGLTVDGILVVEFGEDDRWHVENMVTNGSTFNRCNLDRYKRLRSEEAKEPSEE
jgi:hypothetical protein